MTVPTITPLPTAPSRGVRSTFSALMDAFLAALATFCTQMNASIAAFNTDAGTVNTNATNAATSATNASNSAATATSAASTATNATNVNGTSTTSTTPVLNTAIAFTYVEASRIPVVGMRLRAVSRANPTTNFHCGVVTAWNGLSGAGAGIVTITSDVQCPTPAAAADWNIMVEGAPGVGAVLETAKVSITTSGTLVRANAGAQVVPTNAATITLDKAALLGNGWSVFFPQWPTGFAITLNTSNSETFVSGGTSKSIPAGVPCVLLCDGVNFTLVMLNTYADSEVYVTTGNGFGSTNVATRRFTTTKRSAGSDITYADSATLGGSFTINTPGLYSIFYADYNAGPQTIGISVNAATPSGAPSEAETVAQVLPQGASAGAVGLGITKRFAAGDVLRANAQMASGVSTPLVTGVRLQIVKVGV